MKRELTMQVRLRLTPKEIECVDDLAREFSIELGRDLPRAAILRALARVGMNDKAQRAAIAKHLDADTVRRGRMKGEAQSA